METNKLANFVSVIIFQIFVSTHQFVPFSIRLYRSTKNRS